jgi:hypothetical protein
MTTYITGAAVRKHRCVASAGSGYVGGPVNVVTIAPTPGPEGKIFAGGKEVMRTENGFRVLAAPGLAIGIATQDAPGPGQRVNVADREGDKALAEAGEPFERDAQLISDSEGRVIVARLGVRLSEPILAVAMERSRKAGQFVAVTIAPRGART